MHRDTKYASSGLEEVKDSSPRVSMFTSPHSLIHSRNTIQPGTSSPCQRERDPEAKRPSLTPGHTIVGVDAAITFNLASGPAMLLHSSLAASAPRGMSPVSEGSSQLRRASSQGQLPSLPNPDAQAPKGLARRAACGVPSPLATDSPVALGSASSLPGYGDARDLQFRLGKWWMHLRFGLLAGSSRGCCLGQNTPTPFDLSKQSGRPIRVLHDDRLVRLDGRSGSAVPMS